MGVPLEAVSDFRDPSTAEGKLSLGEVLARDASLQLDPTLLECYLTDRTFSKVFEMDRPCFYEKRPWKQLELKKKVGLH